MIQEAALLRACDRKQLWALCLLLASYVFLATKLGYFEHTDEVYFKSPGTHWLETGIIAAPELEGGLAFRPPLEEIFFAYPPLYPVAFGLYVKLLGFGHLTNRLFDIIIHSCLVFAVYVLALKIGARLATRESYAVRRNALLGAAITIPIATHGRPDELAMVFGIAALRSLLSCSSTSSGTIVGGIALGLCLATSVGVYMAYALATVAFLIGGTESPIRNRISRGFAVAAVSLVTAIMVVAILHGRNAYGISQLAKVLLGHQMGLGLVAGLTSLLKYHFHQGVLFAAFLLASVVAPLVGAWRAKKWLAWWGAIWLFLSFVLLRAPHKGHYLWFLAPLGIALTGAVVNDVIESGMGRTKAMVPLMVVLLCTLLLAYVVPGRELFISATLPEQQRPHYVQTRLARSIPRGTRVIAGPLHWSMLRDRNKVLDSMWSDARRPNLVDYIVVPANGSGRPGLPQRLGNARYQEMLEANFDLVENTLPVERPRLFSVPVSRSSWGYGYALYARRSIQAD
jgi:hypothetical protein